MQQILFHFSRSAGSINILSQYGKLWAIQKKKKNAEINRGLGHRKNILSDTICMFF